MPGFAELVEEVRERVGHLEALVVLLFVVAAAVEMGGDRFAKLVLDDVVDGFSELLEFGVLESGCSGHVAEKLAVGILDCVFHVLAEVAYGREVVFRWVVLSGVHLFHWMPLTELYGNAEQVPEVRFASAYDLGPYGFECRVYGFLADLLGKSELSCHGARDVFCVDHAASLLMGIRGTGRKPRRLWSEELPFDEFEHVFGSVPVPLGGVVQRFAI